MTSMPTTFSNTPPAYRGYISNNPLLFTGRELFKDGPERYRVIDGSMTSCRLPDPDWLLLSSKINVADGTARCAKFLVHASACAALFSSLCQSSGELREPAERDF